LRMRFSVASSSSIRATTISPLSAASVRFRMTISPSRMPAWIMESPRTSRANSVDGSPSSPGIATRPISCSNASIGTPAAMRPSTGISIAAFAAPIAFAETTLGRNELRPRAGAEGVALSGNFSTSSARARCASRRRKPRSSSAVIRRWMPDLEARSSASFISSKEGDTPVSLMR
jgi:hypothetical protein